MCKIYRGLAGTIKLSSGMENLAWMINRIWCYGKRRDLRGWEDCFYCLRRSFLVHLGRFSGPMMVSKHCSLAGPLPPDRW